MPELTQAGVAVITVNATDADSGDNSVITYTMLPMEGFQINSTTGKNRLDNFFSILAWSFPWMDLMNCEKIVLIESL